MFPNRFGAWSLVATAGVVTCLLAARLQSEVESVSFDTFSRLEAAMSRSTVPSYRRQKRANGKHVGFVVIDERRHYLPGPYGSEESKQAYGRMIAETKTVRAPAPTSRDAFVSMASMATASST